MKLKLLSIVCVLAFAAPVQAGCWKNRRFRPLAAFANKVVAVKSWKKNKYRAHKAAWRSRCRGGVCR